MSVSKIIFTGRVDSGTLGWGWHPATNPTASAASQIIFLLIITFILEFTKPPIYIFFKTSARRPSEKIKENQPNKGFKLLSQLLY